MINYYSNHKQSFEVELSKGKKWNGKIYDPYNNKIYKIKNGKGFMKEYDILGLLIFEGEYINGERNGKGKEYIDDKIIFEGEYLNGKKWNGKQYERYNKKIYELKNGKGFIKELDKFGNIIYEGNYINGEKNGKGKEYDKFDALVFEGEYLNGERYNGKLKEYYFDNKVSFEGELFKSKKWNGKIFDPYNNNIYELKNGNGFVKEYDKFGILIFEGEYINGERCGIRENIKLKKK